MSTSFAPSRRQVLAGAGATLLLKQAARLQGQAPAVTVFSRTTIVTPAGVLNDAALAVQGNLIAAIGPTADVLRSYPNAQVIDSRGKALLPGLINCHAHLGATIARGFNEDFGFPNSFKLAVSPNSLLSREESQLMNVVGALEAIRSGATTVVQNGGNIAPIAEALAKSGQRWVFAESIRDTENGGGRYVSGSVGQKRGAQVFRQTARRRDAAHHGSLQRMAWETRASQRVSRRGARGDLLA